MTDKLGKAAKAAVGFTVIKSATGATSEDSSRHATSASVAWATYAVVSRDSWHSIKDTINCEVEDVTYDVAEDATRDAIDEVVDNIIGRLPNDG